MLKNLPLTIAVLLSIGLATAAIAADDKNSPPLPVLPTSGDVTENAVRGIRFSDYAGFYDKWKLVTVSYRVDANEMRFVYANDIAYKVLKAGATIYPDGAVFANIFTEVATDPALPTSALPTGVREYQFMVRDQKKFADTEGWGFAMFDTSGKTAGVSHGATSDYHAYTEQCATCHDVVKNRGYVFSRIPVLDPAGIQDWAKKNATVDHGWPLFDDFPRDQLSERIRKLVPDRFKAVRSMKGALRDHIYYNIVHESRPLLIAEAVRSGQPAMLLSQDQNMLALVEPADPAREPEAMPCEKGQKLMASYWTLSLNPNNWVSKDLFCWMEK